MSKQNQPVVTAQMLIRAPAANVYEAFVDPAITARFWFTRSTGRLEPGSVRTWFWDMYGVSAEVAVQDMKADERILIEWGEPPSSVEWRFDARDDGTTLVRIVSWGFGGSDDEILAAALDSMGGFTMVLASLKAYLEHGIELKLVADHHPDGHVAPDG